MILFGMSSIGVWSQLKFYIAPNTTVVSTPGLDIQIDGTLEINTSASYTHNGNTYLTGDWINNQGWCSASSGTVNFHGSNIQEITGIMGITTYSSYFYNIVMNKDNNTDRLKVLLPIQAFNDVYCDFGTFEVTIGLDKLKVNKIIQNAAIIENFGVIEIGMP